ncbi:MAG: hypothetical protein M1838_004433 [Thelocarpon superellum]|nr:MAG: hypothetical protein M1838_004433 [Thelocarpon superellum]
MSALAHDCRQHLAHDAPPQAELPAVDVAVTTLPYFRDKAEAIATLPVYATTASAGPPQVHLIGYDTLIRILNPKYYPPHHNLEPLAPFLKRHRLRVTYRTDAAWGSLADQAQYVKDLAEGKREHEGGQRAWADRIELVAGRAEGEETVSSTKVRDAVARGDEETLHRLVTPGVSAWILSEQLYQSSEQEQVKQGRRRAA